jgi:hypothetical protein
MRFPPLRYTLPSFPDVAILYRVTMADRPELLRFAAAISKAEGNDLEGTIENEASLVACVAGALVAVDFAGELEPLSELPEHRAEWLRTNFPPRAVQESFAAILSGRMDEAFEKK